MRSLRPSPSGSSSAGGVDGALTRSSSPRLVSNAGFDEGWARYAEALAEEMGLYSSDYALASRRLWPGRGMVVDPGIHLFGWSRERAAAYLAESGRMPPAEADATVDRIAVWPGQFAAYDTGGLEFFALRAKAEEVLGERFDIREFHDVVLGNGSVTLPMLRDQVQRWLEGQARDGSGTLDRDAPLDRWSPGPQDAVLG